MRPRNRMRETTPKDHSLCLICVLVSSIFYLSSRGKVVCISEISKWRKVVRNKLFYTIVFPHKKKEA